MSIFEIGTIQVLQGRTTQGDLLDTLQEMGKSLQKLTDIVQDLLRSIAG